MDRPGGPLASRPLHFIWIADCSGSMDTGGKIQSLNTAIREALPNMREVAHDNPNARVLIRVIAFSSGAHWVVPEPVPVERFTWTDLTAGGVTDLGRALSMVSEVLTVPPMSSRALQPVLVLVSDGHPTDDWQRGLAELRQQPWGAKSICLSLAIGRDADYQVLQEFIGHDGARPLTANNAAELVELIRWVSTAPLKLASNPRIASHTDGYAAPIFTPINVAPTTADIASVVW